MKDKKRRRKGGGKQQGHKDSGTRETAKKPHTNKRSGVRERSTQEDKLLRCLAGHGALAHRTRFPFAYCAVSVLCLFTSVGVCRGVWGLVKQPCLKCFCTCVLRVYLLLVWYQKSSAYMRRPEIRPPNMNLRQSLKAERFQTSFRLGAWTGPGKLGNSWLNLSLSGFRSGEIQMTPLCNTATSARAPEGPRRSQVLQDLLHRRSIGYASGPSARTKGPKGPMSEPLDDFMAHPRLSTAGLTDFLPTWRNASAFTWFARIPVPCARCVHDFLPI